MFNRVIWYIFYDSKLGRWIKFKLELWQIKINTFCIARNTDYLEFGLPLLQKYGYTKKDGTKYYGGE